MDPQKVEACMKQADDLRARLTKWPPTQTAPAGPLFGVIYLNTMSTQGAVDTAFLSKAKLAAQIAHDEFLDCMGLLPKPDATPAANAQQATVQGK